MKSPKACQSFRLAMFLPFFALLCVLAAGCSSVYMKGTPLYTGEYSKPQGPPEDRVNLWPLAYYHEPALSFLWPMGEVTDDHVAVRPLFSVYKLDEEEHEYSLLWPVTEFDFDTDDHHVFPFFWGRDAGEDGYFVFFPLVYGLEWDKDAAFFENFVVFPLFWYERDDYTALFPLFIRVNDGEGYITRVLWPFFNWKTGDSAQGGSVWPLFGRYKRDDERTYMYMFWPLCHYARDEADKSGFQAALPLYAGKYEGDAGWDFLLPLFWRSYDAQSSLLVSPLYYASRDRSDSTFVTPLLARSRSGDSDTWVVPPLLSAVGRDGDERSLWFLAPLTHARWDDEHSTSHIFPLYYHNGEDGLFVSAPFVRKSKDDAGYMSVLGPLYMSGWNGDDGWRMLFPFFFSSEKGEDSTFVTPVVSPHRAEGRDTWILNPLATWYSEDERRRDLWFLGPMSHFGWGEGPDSSHIFPLYGYSGEKEVFVTPLCWHSGWDSDKSLLLTPLYQQGRSGDDMWRMALPLFYQRRKDDDSLLLTPLLGQRGTEDSGTWILPPLVSWLTRRDDERNLWLLAPLSHWGWGGDSVSHHIFPLYGYDGDSKTFISAPFSWRNDDGKGFVNVLGLPFHYSFGRDDWYQWFAPFPLVSGFDKAYSKGSWAFPLYHYKRWKADQGFTFGALFPIFSSTFRPNQTDVSVFPLFHYEDHTIERKSKEGAERLSRRKSFRLAPFPIPLLSSESWREAEKGEEAEKEIRRDSKASMPFLWKYKSWENYETGASESEFAFLWWLYDYKHTVEPKVKEDRKDIVRSRILWRVMHCDRKNDHTSLDVFPFITYDKKASTGYRKFSFVWRLFRYERDDEGDVAMDLLFIPLCR